MGIFSKSGAVPPPQNPVLPLSRPRIQAYLESQGWAYQVDKDGDVGGSWDQNSFYFFLLGDQLEILQVRGQWQRRFPATRENEIILLANALNREKIWPKIYTLRSSNEIGSEVLVLAEVSVDLEHGVTDEQLAQFINCGIYTATRAFELLGERLEIFADE